MEFEHLVQINDPQLSGVTPLSRQQLWLGLLAKTYKPLHFNASLSGYKILGQEESQGTVTVRRMLDFGSFQITDSVELHEGHKTVNRIDPSEVCGASLLVITIEEPDAGALWLRFKYEVASSTGSNLGNCSDQEIDDIRKQAYRAADIDTVRQIRELALLTPDFEDEPPQNGQARH